MNQLLGTINSTEKPMASMHEVVMKKEELLKVLEDNKAKHDTLYEVAVAGYWDTAKERLEKKKRELSEAITYLKDDAKISFGRLEKKLDSKEQLPYSIEVKALRWNTNLELLYPDNHTKDYERAIRMMRSSIYDEVRLSEQEFDSYVLNNWQWKDKFLTANSFYITNAISKSLTGTYIASAGDSDNYVRARNVANNGLAISGVSLF
jgi:hypothetical protein